MPHTQPIPPKPPQSSFDTVPVESRERLDTSNRDFHMIDPSGSIAFTPALMSEQGADIYDVGSPVAEINAGTSRFAVFPDQDGSFVLASTRRGLPTSDGSERYTVDTASVWRLSDTPVTIGRENKPGDWDGTLSARHFQASVDAHGQLVIADAGSLNGTSLRRGEAPSADDVTVTKEIPRPDDVAMRFQEALNSGCAELTEKLLHDHPELTPTRSVQVGEREFFLSDIIGQSKSRPNAVMYTRTLVNGQEVMVPRLLYMSHSDGGWRVTYGMQGRRYTKEANIIEYHYTQETKLARHILEALAEQPALDDPQGSLGQAVRDMFDREEMPMREIDTAPQEVRYYHSEASDAARKPVQLLSAGQLSNNYRDVLRLNGFETCSEYVLGADQVFRDTPGFLPDFRRDPSATYASTHSILGPIMVEEFPAVLDGRDVVWSMAHDREGRVWVENVSFPGADITSYGNRGEVLDMGIVTSKPVEYTNQSNMLQDGVERVGLSHDKSHAYKDITPVLDNLLPIAFYREARGITRSAPVQPEREGDPDNTIDP